MKIIPAIIPESKEHLRATLEKVRGVVSEVQIDLVDGVYAGKPAWPFSENVFDECVSALSELAQSYDIELDLMVREPEKYLEQLVSVARRIVVHWGSTTQLEDILKLRNEKVKFGIALTNDIPLEEFYPYADQIDFVQCMGIAEAGAQGNDFDPRVLPRIREIHARYPRLEISVDGHVTMFTLSLLKDAGVTRFVSGSAIFGADNPSEAFKNMQMLVGA